MFNWWIALKAKELTSKGGFVTSAQYSIYVHARTCVFGVGSSARRFSAWTPALFWIIFRWIWCSTTLFSITSQYQRPVSVMSFFSLFPKHTLLIHRSKLRHAISYTDLFYLLNKISRRVVMCISVAEHLRDRTLEPVYPRFKSRFYIIY